MLKKITFPINNYINAFSFIKKNKLSKFYLIPGIINIILVLIFFFLSSLFSDFIIKFSENIVGENFNEYIQTFIKFIMYLSFLATYYLLYKTLVLVILSPFLSYLSEKTESIIRNKEFNYTIKDNIYFIKRGIRVTLQSFLREFFFTVIILLLFFIPPFVPFIPLLIFLVQSYYIGFAFVDYTLERHDYNIGTQVIRKNPVFFLINGGLFTLILFIPFIGIFIAPLVTVIATTTGTLKLLEEEKQL
ncbi:MAG: EI24 domain-containing protein [Psychrilyobacter sp.]|nr:EI24 domain-containing protein [Psychrilyobacter sp.]